MNFDLIRFALVPRYSRTMIQTHLHKLFPPIAARRGRENEDEIWKQLEQLRLDQLRLGLDVQRVATQSRYREEGQGTVVGKGRSRHTRTSPNQNSLIYKIAQEKAQEMAANQSNSKNGLVFI